MEIDTEYRNQEGLYRRVVHQYGRDNKGNQYFKMNDTGTSFELINTGLKERGHIYVTIELPVAIKEGATSQVNMMACLSDFGDDQRFRGNDNNEDASYWDGLESMISTLERFKRFRNILYAPKKIDNPKFDYNNRSGYTGENERGEKVHLKWTPEGPEYIYTIPTETEKDLIHLVTDFRLDPDCVYRLHPRGREKWQLIDLYLDR
ncbi:hypothetical protein HYX13_03815 [Candidatus Woesearchaeota archaeon]|nr:hypothetical protein [Candidatus Woesearchaeota archaeon]